VPKYRLYGSLRLNFLLPFSNLNLTKRAAATKGATLIDSRRFGRTMLRLTCGGEGEKGLVFKSVLSLKHGEIEKKAKKNSFNIIIHCWKLMNYYIKAI
jgi:hypothetical protein